MTEIEQILQETAAIVLKNTEKELTVMWTFDWTIKQYLHDDFIFMIEPGVKRGDRIKPVRYGEDTIIFIKEN